MTTPISPRFEALGLDDLASLKGRVAVFVDEDARLNQAARRLNTASRKAVERFVASAHFAKMKTAEVAEIGYPAGLAADGILVVKLPRRPTVEEARKAGGALAKAARGGDLTVLAANVTRAQDVAFGLVMRNYDFTDHKTAQTEPGVGAVTIRCNGSDEINTAYAPLAAVVEGVFFSRDLVNAPANVLTTKAFAEHLAALKKLGVEVEVLEEPVLEQLGMGALLCVGQGSASPSKVVVMQWKGGGDEAPFALVGKGVVFDTGGISIKPALGMQEMTMDMGGAGTVAGVMKTLALRGAKANVVGVVGLVENMPSGTATRPGDVVTSMKGDTIEVINTDAEGRLVLADVLWYAQERFKPVGMINLATLTGAIIVALGHENTGVFSNSDALAGDFLKAAADEGEAAWRMPMGQAYSDKLKSRIADVMNVGGRPGGAVIAAEFLRRFVRDEVPWCHLDIAGTALLTTESPLAPKGATGWGVMALNRLIHDRYEA